MFNFIKKLICVHLISYKNSKLYKIITIINACLLSAILGSILGLFITNYAAIPFIKGTYLRSVNLPNLNNATAIMILTKFNDKAGGGILKFKGYRPITIVEGKIESTVPGRVTLGRALVLPGSCEIIINSEEISSFIQFKQVLIHEYLHCFGYRHTKEKKDLMYYSSDGIVSEDNIEYYAKDLKKKLYGTE